MIRFLAFAEYIRLIKKQAEPGGLTPGANLPKEVEVMVNKWFEETFIPSFFDKMKNPKYPGRALLSDRQFEICTRYMDCGRYCWTYKTNKVSVSVYTQGRYNFISIHRYPYRVDNRISWARFERQEIQKHYN